MKRSVRLFFMFAGFCVMWSATFYLLAGAAEEGSEGEKALTSVEKLREGLDSKVDVNIIEQPLSLAITSLSEQVKLPMVVDRFTLANFGIDLEQIPVTYKAKQVKLRTALKQMLAPRNLSFAIIGDSVVISSSQILLQRQLAQRVSVDVKKLPLSEAMEQLTKRTAVNLVLDPRAGEKAKSAITLKVDEVPLSTAVKLMAIMADLRMLQIGNVFFVTSKETAQELAKDPTITAPGGNPGLPVDPGFPGMIPGGFGGGFGALGGFGGIGPGGVPAPPIDIIDGGAKPVDIDPAVPPGDDIPDPPRDPR